MAITRHGATKFSWELADKICRHLEDGKTLREVCKRDDIDVTDATVRRWAVEGYGVNDNFERHDRPGGFPRMVKVSFDMGLMALAEEMLEISDDGSKDWKMNARGEPMVDQEAVKRSELRVKARQWYMSKLMPQVFGDRVEVHNTHTVEFKNYDTGELVEMMRRTAIEAGVDLKAIAAQLLEGEIINGEVVKPEAIEDGSATAAH